MNFRELGARDINYISAILSDMVANFGITSLNNVFVLEDNNVENIIILTEEYVYIYKMSFENNQYTYKKIVLKYNNGNILILLDNDKRVTLESDYAQFDDLKNNTSELLEVMKSDFYDYNRAVIGGFNDYNNKEHFEYGYGMNDYNNSDRPYIMENYLSRLLFLHYRKGLNFKVYRYIDDTFFHYRYMYQSIKNKLFYGEDFKDGLYASGLFSLGKSYSSLKDIKELKGPSKDLIRYYNNEDKEVLNYQRYLVEVLNYNELRKDKITLELKMD